MLLIKCLDVVTVDDQVAITSLIGFGFDLFEQPAIMGQEVKGAFELVFDQSRIDHQVPADLGVDLTVTDFAAGNDGDSE